jgi:hypothetical protein
MRFVFDDHMKALHMCSKAAAPQQPAPDLPAPVPITTSREASEFWRECRLACPWMRALETTLPPTLARTRTPTLTNRALALRRHTRSMLRARSTLKAPALVGEGVRRIG